MSSILIVRKTPKPSRDEMHFGLPVKAVIARKFYDHDGSCGGPLQTIGPEHLEWFEGVIAGGISGADKTELRNFERIVNILREGGSIDLSWSL